MNDSSRSSSAGRGTARWLTAMTVAEVALAIVMVAGAGWLVRGFSGLRNADAGFVTDNRLLFDVSFLGQRYPSPDAVRQAELDLMAAVRPLPGVTSVGLVSNYPMRGRIESSLLTRFPGEPFDPANAPVTRQRIASTGLFGAMGTGLVKGRDFTDADLPTAIPVAIVNRAFVERNLGGRDPIGVRFSAGYPQPDPRNELTIVGVVDDVRQKSLSDPGEPSFYQPMTQVPVRRATAVVTTSGADLAPIETAIRAEVRKLNPAMAVDFELASDIVGATIRRLELGMVLMLVFGGMAVVLAAVGIYGVVSYAGSLRREEMATRLALGASPRDVFLLIMRQGATLGIAGAAIGLGLAYFSGRVVASRLYAIKASDPLILGVAVVLISAITFVATTIPASRASRLSPARALQSE